MVKKDFAIQLDSEADQFVHQIASQWKLASLSDADQQLCCYAEKLTRTPTAMNDRDVAALKRHEFCDQSIHDATQVISYFNYINRIADALDVDLEEGIHAWEQSSPTAVD